MSNSLESKFKFLHFVIPKFNFEKSPKEIGELQLDISSTPKYFQDRKMYNLSLEFKVTDTNKSLNLRCLIIGIFQNDEDDEDIRERHFLYSAPGILLPHARAFVASMSQLSGLDVILLPSIDLQELAKQVLTNLTITTADKETAKTKNKPH